MKLYRIKQKSTGLYLAWGVKGYPDACHFDRTGCFWKKPDTINRWLYELCCDREWAEGRTPEHPTHYVMWNTPIVFLGYRPERLEWYEVEVITVSVENAETLPSYNFVDHKVLLAKETDRRTNGKKQIFRVKAGTQPICQQRIRTFYPTHRK